MNTTRFRRNWCAAPVSCNMARMGDVAAAAGCASLMISPKTASQGSQTDTLLSCRQPVHTAASCVAHLNLAERTGRAACGARRQSCQSEYSRLQSHHVIPHLNLAECEGGLAVGRARQPRQVERRSPRRLHQHLSPRTMRFQRGVNKAWFVSRRRLLELEITANSARSQNKVCLPLFSLWPGEAFAASAHLLDASEVAGQHRRGGVARSWLAPLRPLGRPSRPPAGGPVAAALGDRRPPRLLRRARRRRRGGRHNGLRLRIEVRVCQVLAVDGAAVAKGGAAGGAAGGACQR